MSIKTFKNKQQWERCVPHCAICVHVIPAKTRIISGMKRSTPPFCKQGQFFTKPLAVCNLWQDATGTTLE